MVLPLLLSDPSTVLRYGDLGRTVLHCLHVVHSMERALSIFFEALTYVDCDNETTPPSCSLSSFDAHVGDCACQTRAQMFWDLFTFYRKQENKQILSDAITELRSIKASTALLLEEIELSHGKPRNPKLILLVNHMAVWERIGFHAFLELAVKVPEEPTSVSKDITEPQAVKCAERSGHRRRDILVDTDWNPQDIVSVSRLLTMCNLLSEFRFANIEAGPPTRVKVRVDLQLMYERNAKELEELNLTGKRRLNYHIKAHEKMNRQTEAMQIYVSRVTANWVKQEAVKEGNLWSCFPEDFIATSHRKITCIASYASFLLVRDAWMKSKIPILLMVQHFCSHGGYRNVYCRIVPSPAVDLSAKDYSAIGGDHWFDTEVLTLEQVTSAPWNKVPHTIMVGMSCQGTIEDFKLKLLESQQGLLPVQHRCGQADECALTIERTNISRLVAHFFAQHEQFPFTLPGGENEFERVGNALQRSLGDHAEAAFSDARTGADKFGTGRSARLVTLEHIFLEYPNVFANNMKVTEEKPQVLGCQLE